VVTKKYYLNVTSEGKNHSFVRYAYTPVDQKQNCVLIKYTSDKTAVPYPHGNSKCSKPYIRTYPYVLKTSVESPANVYKHLVSNLHCSPDLQPVLTPRNVKQICNAQSLQQQASRLSHDALYNLHEMAYDTSGFVQRMETYPNLVVICALQDLIEELNRMIQADLNAPILLSYDTTFCLGDIYVSPFLYRHVLFDCSPVIPAVFFIA